MKSKIIILFCLLSFFSVENRADTKKTFKGDLKSVTVFFKGAELNHKSTVNLLKGENEIYIEGLSPNIDVSSLKIKTAKGVLVSAYEFSIDHINAQKVQSPKMKKLADSLTYYDDKYNELEIEKTINEELKSFLQQGTDKNVYESEKGLSIDELKMTIDYYKTKALEISFKEAEIREKQAAYYDAMIRLREQYDEESTKNDKTSGVLKLTLQSSLATASDIDVSYYTSSAGWVPYYDINVESVDKPMKFMVKSKVKQTTGLDWTNIKLSLSTSTPSNGKVAPLFNAWFLQNMQYGNLSTKINSLKSVQNSFSDYWSVGASTINFDNDNTDSEPIYRIDGQIVGADYVNGLNQSMIKNRNVTRDGSREIVDISLKNSMDDYISVSDNEVNMVYNIDMAYSIPGNGKEQNVDLQTFETSADYKYYSAPKLDSETFLLAEISNWQKLNLLTGKANITYDGTFVGQTFIDANSTNSKLGLTLGTDKRISVKREKVIDYSSKNFTGNNIKQEFSYKITVKNNQNKAVKLTLKDQYPRSTQKEIEVELIKDKTTTWTNNKEESGVITWDETLNPGETKTYKITYTVKYPKDYILNLN